MVISFSREIPQGIEMAINSSSIDIDLLPEQEDERNISKLNFTWSFIAIMKEKQELELKLDFDEPLWLDLAGPLDHGDTIQASCNDPSNSIWVKS